MSTALETSPPTPTTTPSPTSAPGRPRRRGTPAWVGAIGYLVVLAEVVLFSLATDRFLAPENLFNIVSQGAVYAIAGFGLAVVIITGGDDVIKGGIDLSTGVLAGLSGIVAAVAIQAGLPTPAAVLLALAVSALFGLVNGTAVVLGVRPLLTTLATMGIVGSVTFVATDNVKIPLNDPFFDWLRGGDVLGVPTPVVVLLGVYLVMSALVGGSTWGLRSYAVGQNPVAATVAGIRPTRYIAGSYIVSALLAGIAGLLLASRLSAAVPGIGGQILLDIVLAGFMSVVFSRRLVVSITGTLMSALFVAALANGFTLLGVESQWVGAVKGLLILLVLAVAAIRERTVRR